MLKRFSDRKDIETRKKPQSKEEKQVKAKFPVDNADIW